MRPYALAAAAVLAASGLTAASAAPARKPACLQVVDDEGDAKVMSAVDAPSLDILSADIATGKRNLVAAVRLKTAERDPFLVTGRTFYLQWTVGGVRQMLLLTEYDSGEVLGEFYPVATNATEGIPVSAVLDKTSATVVWTVPRGMVAALKKPGAKFGQLEALASDGRNLAATGSKGRGRADLAASGKVYTDLAPTCLKGT